MAVEKIRKKSVTAGQRPAIAAAAQVLIALDTPPDNRMAVSSTSCRSE
jgi:hypothetical protein